MKTTKTTKPAARIFRSGQPIKSKQKPVPQFAPRRDPWVWLMFGPNKQTRSMT